MTIKHEKTQLAIKALQAVPSPEPHKWRVDRQKYLSYGAELAMLHQDRKQAQPDQHTGVISIFIKEKTPMAIALKALVVLTLLFGGTVGTASAAEGSIPGSTLYPVKMQLENWQLNTVKEPQRQAILALKFAQNRMDEVEILMYGDQEVPAGVVERYQEQLRTALQAIESLPEPLKEQLKNQVRSMLALHTETMTRLQQRTRADGELEEALQSMNRVMEQLQAQLGERAGQVEDPARNKPEETGSGAGSMNGQGEPPEDQPGYAGPSEDGQGNGPGDDSQNGPGEAPADPGNDMAPEETPQGPAEDAGDGQPPAETPGSGPADNAGEGDQDGSCSADGNCGDSEGDGNNGAGDNGGSDGGEPSGGDNSEGDNSGGDNGGSGGNGGGNGG
ncbi:MAG: DUF5667 domain-containing protein [Anaerolineae bacterium]|nr:DUF5667 domain-containing protein [Anaerolineae bacterium]